MKGNDGTSLAAKDPDAHENQESAECKRNIDVGLKTQKSKIQGVALGGKTDVDTSPEASIDYEKKLRKNDKKDCTMGLMKAIMQSVAFNAKGDGDIK